VKLPVKKIPVIQVVNQPETKKFLQLKKQNAYTSVTLNYVLRPLLKVTNGNKLSASLTIVILGAEMVIKIVKKCALKIFV